MLIMYAILRKRIRPRNNEIYQLININEKF